jgi:hypothetical protein
MTGIGVGNYRSNEANIKNEVSNSAGQFIHRIIDIKTDAEIKADIDAMKDKEELVKDCSPVDCKKCGAVFYTEENDACPNCGKTPGDEENLDEDSIDMDNEEIPANSETEEEFEEQPVAIDLSRRIEDVLYELGFDTHEAIRCGLVLAGIYEQNKSVDEALYKQYINEHGDIDTAIKSKLLVGLVIQNILGEFETISAEADNSKGSPAQCNIDIKKDSNGCWIVHVNDTLGNMNLDKPNARVYIHKDFSISIARYVSTIKQRREFLESLGGVLISEMGFFFEAKTPAGAEEMLRGRRLEQKKIAEKVGISETTMSRRCRDESIWVSTLHGAFPLGDFFKSGTRGKGGVTREAICDMIRSVECLYQGDNNESKNDFILRCLKEGFKNNDGEFKMSRRSLSNYLKKCPR